MELLYILIIAPIETIIDAVFTIIYQQIGNPGFAIMAVSLVVNLLVLPMYNRADAIQEEERKKQKTMERWTEHIRKTFQGDERYMMLSTYYRINHYHPVYALRGMLSLLLQIPFFIAAYHYLSNLPLLNGQSFFVIRDLARPDELLHFTGARGWNALPVLMTVINLLSAGVYLQGAARREKIQTLVMALVFLVLLYTSPAGLVLYWTCNNLFSLFKNLFVKHVKRKKEVLSAAAALTGVLLIPYAYRFLHMTPATTAGVYLVVLLLWLPLCVLLLRKNRGGTATPWMKRLLGEMQKTTVYTKQFLLSGVLLTVVFGLWIPSAVLRSSPAEFINFSDYKNPVTFNLIRTLCMSAGMFLVWVQVLFLLSGEKAKKIAAAVALPVCGAVILDFIAFGKSYSTISTELIFDAKPDPSFQEKLINLGCLAVLCIVLFSIRRLRHKAVLPLLGIVTVSLLCVSIFNMVQANDEIARTRVRLQDLDRVSIATNEEEKIFTFSSTGQNVLVIVLDRGIDKFVPFILAEFPELQAQFDGFVWYPNTISHGHATIYGTPALYGGYDYTPVKMNERDTELLVDKHNEALKVAPRVFADNGFQVNICDIPWANYEQFSDMSIYEGEEGVETHVLANATSDEFSRHMRQYHEQYRYRQFFGYAMFRALPVLLQPDVYDNGNYFRSVNVPVISEPTFMESYPGMALLDNITQVTNAQENYYVQYYSQAPHGPCELQMPDYEPAIHVDNSGFNTTKRMDAQGNVLDMTDPIVFQHYCVNAASLLRVGEWLQVLHDNGAYDNTRIIIVSDHGFNMNLFPEVTAIDVGWYNPMFMSKDFNAHGDLVRNDTFMTNADTTWMAMEGVIDNPVNPYTGNPIRAARKDPAQVVTTAALPMSYENRGTVFETEGNPWFTVRENIFMNENWEVIENP